MGLKLSRRLDPIKRVNLSVKASSLAGFVLIHADAERRARRDGYEKPSLSDVIEMLALQAIENDREMKAMANPGGPAFRTEFLRLCPEDDEPAAVQA